MSALVFICFIFFNPRCGETCGLLFPLAFFLLDSQITLVCDHFPILDAAVSPVKSGAGVL